VGLTLTAAATWWQARENRHASEAAVRSAAEGLAADVTERLFLYQYGLRGLRGAILTAGETGVTYALLERYSASRDIDMEFPGARGFGFVRRVPVAEEAAYLERVRADGRPDFHIFQLAPSTRERMITEYIAPFSRNAAAIGLDIASDPNRREAAEVSMRTGQTAISAPITLLQNPDKTQKSFLLMMPIYRPGAPTRTPEEREANTFGWSYAALSINDVMDHLRLDQTQLHLALRDVTRPDAEEILYQSSRDSGQVREFTQQLERAVFGRQWVIEVSAHPAFIRGLNLTRPRSVAIIGVLASLLLAALAGAESVSRRRKYVIAARMADFNAQLERQVVERTEELMHAKAAAEAANAAKSRFLAIMSHELRTPMAGVLGMGELLMSSDLKAGQRRLMTTLMGSARTLLDLLNDILDFAKIEAGRVDLEEVDFSIREIIDDVREVLTPLAAAKGNIIETQVHASLTAAQRGDAKRYRQIIMNLVGNANKFTKKGRITIEAKALPLDGGQILIETTVTDTGVGISADNRDRLFQPFVQEDTSTSRRYGGTGLGLAISKTLAELMGGRIWVDSELGVGSAFSFTVVLRVGDPAKVVSTAEAARGGAAAAQATRPLRVLVAEDNETNRMLAIRLLSKMGHTVTAAENGAVAVAEFGRAAFDVVLMDMQMPVMDGPGAIRVIRAHERPPARVPIIALTADAMREHHREYLEAGADVIMTKPVDWSLLAAEMDRLTRGETVVLPLATGGGEKGPAPVLNLPLLGEMFDSLGAELPALLENMTREANRFVDLLREAALRGETETARRTAHALKGLASQFGAPRLAAVAARAEQVAKRGENVEPLLAEIEAMAGEALAALSDWRLDAVRRDKTATSTH
jgi:signal transduction histidine kinase/CheY-like chemotaxis protein/HPt (histidine-containing phosphotransfer) domain-containing protein